MSDSTNPNEHQAHVATVVRRNVWPAAIAAVLLCYYGFETVPIVPVAASPLLENSNLLFYHTLRVGGVALASLAVWCWLGKPLALAVDGVVSVLIGVLFLLCGGGMLIGSGGSIGINTILIILFGMMFFGSGRHNWQTYQHLVAGGRVVTEVYTETFQTPVSTARSAEPAPIVEAPALYVEDATAPDTLSTRRVELTTEEAPPEGFLAAMAKKPPPSEP